MDDYSQVDIQVKNLEDAQKIYNLLSEAGMNYDSHQLTTLSNAAIAYMGLGH